MMGKTNFNKPVRIPLLYFASRWCENTALERFDELEGVGVILLQAFLLEYFKVIEHGK